MNDFQNELAALMKLAEKLEKDETSDYFVSYIVDRIDNAYAATRDPGLHMLRNAVAANADRMIMSRAELGSLWDGVQSSVISHDAVQSQIGDLIGGSALQEITRTIADTGEAQADLDISVSAADKYAGLFGNHSTSMRKLADAIEAEAAGEGVEAELELAAQDTRFAVFAARIRDGVRQANVLIPVEVNKGQACLPSVFYGTGFAEFNGRNLIRCANMGIETDMSAAGLLDTLNQAAGPMQSVSATEEWVGNPSSGSAFDLGDQATRVIGDEFAPSELSVEARQAGGENFERIFREATVKCGFDALVRARSLVSQHLAFARVKHDNIVVESEFEGGIRLGTNIKTANGGQFVIVPVEFGENGPLIPEIMQVGNTVHDFSEEALQAVAASGESDLNAMSSGLNGMSYGDLHRIVIRAAQNADLAGAEEAMAVILESHGEELYRRAFQDMADLMTKSASEDRSSFDSYADELAEKGNEIAHYVATRTNAAEFGLLD